MRPAAETVKQALLSSDPEVRTAAAHYFHDSAWRRDPAIMQTVVQAFEQYGPEAFQGAWFVAELEQSEETLLWLIDSIERIDPDADDQSDMLWRGLTRALCHAPVTLLIAHESTIQNMQGLERVQELAIAERIALSACTCESLWCKVDDFCAGANMQDDISDEQLEFAHSLVAALAAFPAENASRVLEILDQGEDAGDWQEILAVRLAGRLQLAEAIGSLLDLLEEVDTCVHDEAIFALAEIGTDEVVLQAMDRYAEGDEELRQSIASLMSQIHTDSSVQCCLDCLETERDPVARMFLLQSLLQKFCSEGIEPAREYVRSTPKDPDVVGVRQSLLVAAKILNVTFPEFDEWAADAEGDHEFITQWYGEKIESAIGERRLDDPQSFGTEFDREGPWQDDETLPDDDPDLLEDDEPTHPDTVVRHEERVGRNDPCPCGSGKKYKKCCWGKASQLNEITATTAHPARPPAPKRQFPLGTVILYGPDDKVTTKIVASVFKYDGAEPVLRRWVGTNIGASPKVQRELESFFKGYRVKSTVVTDGNLGCPHEEGEDFPVGEDCPFCPFWAGKQGTAKPTEG